MNILTHIRATALDVPGRIAVYFGTETLMYEALIRRVEQYGVVLQASGVSPGMGVGIMGTNSAEFICRALAVFYCDAVVLPISHNLKTDELDKLCRSTQLHFLWDDQSGILPDSWNASDVLRIEDGWRLSISPYAAKESRLVSHVDNAALIRFTSGTTGTAKGVILSHESIDERLVAANRKLRLGSQDTVIWVLSMAYHFVVSILLYLRYGCSICICEEFLADVILDDILRCKGTFLYVSPTHIRMLAADPTGRTMESVHTVISTSTGIAAADCQRFYSRYGLPVSQAYGIIEIGLPILNDAESVGVPEAVGYALPDYTVDILDPEGRPLPAETIGHLAIKGPGMFAAYLDPPTLLDSVLKNGYFHTGDLAIKRDDGLIRIAGRKKSMINVAGNKVFPEEVEDVLNGHPAIRLSRVTGFAHPILMEGVMAEVVLEAGAEIDVESLISYCRRKLSAYKVPQKVHVVDALPMTDSGKLIRHDAGIS
jgi:long-chain acyl-CoA synthetase